MSVINNILQNDKKINKITKVIFNSVDKDGSGLIDSKELSNIIIAIYEDLGLKAPGDKEIKEVFSLLDKNGSGTINVREFKPLIKCFLQYLAE